MQKLSLFDLGLKAAADRQEFIASNPPWIEPPYVAADSPNVNATRPSRIRRNVSRASTSPINLLQRR